MSKRLFLIQQKIDEVIKEHKPTHMSLEMIFQNTNQKTVTNVSAVRGIILACAGKNELPVLEFSPPQIKLAVCGNGRADKKNVHKMVSLLTNNKYINKLDDEMDAIAVGLTALAHIKE